MFPIEKDSEICSVTFCRENNEFPPIVASITRLGICNVSFFGNSTAKVDDKMDKVEATTNVLNPTIETFPQPENVIALTFRIAESIKMEVDEAKILPGP